MFPLLLVAGGALLCTVTLAGANSVASQSAPIALIAVEADASDIEIVGDDSCIGDPDPGGDAWPADFDANQVVGITAIVQMLPPYFGSTTCDPNYSERRDLVPGSVIGIPDVFKILPPTFGAVCVQARRRLSPGHLHQIQPVRLRGGFFSAGGQEKQLLLAVIVEIQPQ